jgi:NAD(P)-dependent dehydrogenase (short-subunit alcohol dehydrogenase family)
VCACAAKYELKPEEVKIIGIGCNVASEADVAAGYTKIIEAFGQIDVVVASAGEGGFSPLSVEMGVLKTEQASWRTTLHSSEIRLITDMLYTCANEVICSYPAERVKLLYDINVHGVFYTAREAAKLMIPRGTGSIILVSSMSANVSERRGF